MHRKWKGWIQRASPSFSLCFLAGRARMPGHRGSLLVSGYIVSPCCVSVCASAGLCEEQGKISRGFPVKPAAPVIFPLPSQKEKPSSKFGKTNDCRAFPPCDLGKPPKICATKAFSERPTCSSSSFKHLMPVPPMPVGTSESHSPLPAGMDCMVPTNAVLYSCSLS